MTTTDPAPGAVPRPESRAAAMFRDRFGSVPSVAFQAPGRVNLIGEHTDYNAGLVLPIAINRRCVAAGSPRQSNGHPLRIVANAEAMVEFDGREPLDPAAVRSTYPKWAWYVAGVVEMVRRRGGQVPAVDIAIASSVPLGSGLSSSASLEVAVAELLLHVAGLSLPPVEIALLCQAAEHEFASVPCGLMDQLASVSGRAGHALLIDCRDNRVTPVKIPPDVLVLVINTNVHHNLAAGQYASRRAACESAAAALGVPTLRDATVDLLRRQGECLTPDQHRCVRHVLTEIARTSRAADVLRSARSAADLAPLRTLFADSHASLRDDFRVSCAELDSAVEIAASTPGVLAARLTGGGFGGCAIALVHADHAAAAASIIANAQNRRFPKPCDVFWTTPGPGAGRVDTDRLAADTSPA